MLGLTLWRALQPATIPTNTVSALGGQVMEMKSQRFSQDELQQSWLGSAVRPEYTSVHALLCNRVGGCDRVAGGSLGRVARDAEGPHSAGEVAQPNCRLLGPADSWQKDQQSVRGMGMDLRR